MAPANDRVILGQASNPNKDEFPDRGTRRIKGGGRVSEWIEYDITVIMYCQDWSPESVANGEAIEAQFSEFLFSIFEATKAGGNLLIQWG